MFPFGMDPEQRAEHEEYVQNLREKAFARRAADEAEVAAMLQGMDVQQLVTLRRLIYAFMMNEDWRHVAAFEGEITGILKHVHKVCHRCGANHTDEALAEILGAEPRMHDVHDSHGGLIVGGTQHLPHDHEGDEEV